MLPEVFYPILLFAAVSCYPAAPKTELILLQPAQPQFLQAYTVQPKPEADNKNQYVFFYPNQYYYLRDEETSWFQSFQNWFAQSQAQSQSGTGAGAGTTESAEAAENPNSGSNAANPSPASPEQATRIYQRIDGEASGEKGEKKYYYLVPTSGAAPPQFFRQINPFQAIPSVRPVFAAPSAGPIDAKSAFVLQPVTLRAGFKDGEQSKAEIEAQINTITPQRSEFVLSPSSSRAGLKEPELSQQPEGQMVRVAVVEDNIPLQLRSDLTDDKSTQQQPQLQQVDQSERQLNLQLQHQLSPGQIQQSERLWSELQQQQHQLQQQQQPLLQALQSERLRSEQQQQEQQLQTQAQQSERILSGNPEEKQPEPVPQLDAVSSSNPAQGIAQAKSSEANTIAIYASPDWEKRDDEQKRSGEENKKDDSNRDETRRADDSSIAQAKPNGLSLAGEGGVASSSPHATALVGKNGLALSSPTATAVAGDFGSLGAAGILSNNGK